ncbi:hypothetical protein BDFB_013554, partial [Asbolus verrucosus]
CFEFCQSLVKIFTARATLALKNNNGHKHISEIEDVVEEAVCWPHEVTKFTSEAANEKCPMMNVKFLIKLSGACRRNGKCTVYFSKIPGLVATYLELFHPEGYTDRSSRGSSASLLIGLEPDI